MKTAEENEQNEQKEDKDPGVRVVDRRWWARGDAPEAGESGARKPTYIEELEQRLADTTAQLQRVLTEHRRSLDEFEQVKGRLRRDVGKDVERSKRALLAELLDVLDNLDRAVEASREAGDPSATGETAAASGSSETTGAPDPGAPRRYVARGIALVRDQFLNKLEGFGVARVPALGQSFDARKHEAVTTTPVDDPATDGVVVAVIKEGYSIGDDVLRPAAVVVGRHDP